MQTAEGTVPQSLPREGSTVIVDVEIEEVQKGLTCSNSPTPTDTGQNPPTL